MRSLSGSAPKSVIAAKDVWTWGLLTEAVSDSTPVFYPFEIVRPNNERNRTEVLLETFIRKQLRLKAHTVTKVEETDEFMIIWIDRLGKRLLRCGVCRQRCRHVHRVRKGRACP